MSWPKIVLLCWYAISIVVNITQVGKDRKPLDPGTVAIMAVFTGGLAALVVIA